MMKLWMLILSLGLPLVTSSRASEAQQPTTAPATTAPAAAQELSPEVSAFMQRVEVAQGDDELRQKLKERLNTAQRLLELRVEEHRKGVVDALAVFDAVRLVADAKLELAQDDNERQAVRAQILHMSKFIESRLERQFQSGFGSAADLERARLARETAEIELLKLKRPGTAPTTRGQ